MILRENKVDTNGNWISDGYGQWQGPYQISGTDGTGTDSDGIHFIYKSTPNKNASLPEGLTSNNLSDGWVESASDAEINGVDKLYSWMAFSTKKNSAGYWINFQGPILWSVWGSTGIDGDGVEYIFYVTTQDVNWNEVDGDINPENWTVQTEKEEYIQNANWKDDPQKMNAGDYQWVSKRTYSWIALDANNKPVKSEGKGWGPYSKPQLWSYYAKDGKADGYVVDLDNSSLAVTVDDEGLLSLGLSRDFEHKVIVNVNKSGTSPVPYIEGTTDLTAASAEAPIYVVETLPNELEEALAHSSAPGAGSPNYWYYSDISSDGRGIDVTIVSADKILAEYSSYLGSNGSTFETEATAKSEINLKKHRVRFNLKITVYDSYTNSTTYSASVYNRSFYVYGVYTGHNGAAGYNLDLKCSTNTVHIARKTGARNPQSVSVWCLKTRGDEQP